MNDVRWGVLGAGWLVNQATAGAIHHAEGATLQATAARDLARAEATQPVRAYADYRAVIDSPDVDAVYICLSNDAHLTWIRAALAAGKHVLCEKPMVLTAADAELAFAEATAAGLLLVEATWSRWHPRMRRLVDVVTSGGLGEVEAFLGTFTFPAVPEGNYRLSAEHGGGALYDIGIYPLHALYACLPDVEEVGVVAVDRDLGGTEVDLTTKAALTWPNHPSGSGAASVVASFTMPESQRLVVRGAESETQIDDDQAFTSWRQASQLRVGAHVESFAPVDAYQVMFEEVSSLIRGGEGWALPPRDSLRVARTVDAIRAAR